MNKIIKKVIKKAKETVEFTRDETKTKVPVVPTICRDEKLSALIQHEVYNLFDSVPRESVNKNAVDRLVQQINEI